MKRRKATSDKGRASGKAKQARLLERVPEVYLGPGAFGSLHGGSGILQGMQRPGRVDLMEFQPLVEGGYRRLIDARFLGSGDWDTVGIVIRKNELVRRRIALIRDLVPGDVVLACSERNGETAAYVNVGDALLPARLKVSRKKSSSTSALSGRPP